MARRSLRTNRVVFVVSDAELEMLDRLAVHGSETVSEVLRRLVRRESQRVLDLEPADLAKPKAKPRKAAR